MNEHLQLRIYGDQRHPTLVYLPGLHGDWTLIGSFRRAVAGRVRFVEITYPRTLTWSLEDYAAEIETALVAQGVLGGWLLAESFGSQIAWPLAARGEFTTQGIILAGGFGAHPFKWGVRLAERMAGHISPALLTPLNRMYAWVSQVRYRCAPEVLSTMDEFISRRTDLDRQAAQHRLELIFGNNPCELARGTRAPVYAMTGLFDPIVPWWPVGKWLRRHCPSLREQKLVWHADHTVLVTGANAAAEQVLRWVQTPGCSV